MSRRNGQSQCRAILTTSAVPQLVHSPILRRCYRNEHSTAVALQLLNAAIGPSARFILANQAFPGNAEVVSFHIAVVPA